MLVHKIKSLVNPNPNPSRYTYHSHACGWDDEDGSGYLWRGSHDTNLTHHRDTRRDPKKFDKLGYSQYLDRIGLKKGDVLISKSQADKPVNQVQSCWMSVVLDIQEIHHLATYFDDYRPKIAFVRGLSDQGSIYLPFWSSPEHYNIVKFEELSDVSKVAYDKAFNSGIVTSN